MPSPTHKKGNKAEVRKKLATGRNKLPKLLDNPSPDSSDEQPEMRKGKGMGRILRTGSKRIQPYPSRSPCPEKSQMAISPTPRTAQSPPNLNRIPKQENGGHQGRDDKGNRDCCRVSCPRAHRGGNIDQHGRDYKVPRETKSCN
jgi:hypothetical protein